MGVGCRCWVGCRFIGCLGVGGGAVRSLHSGGG